MIRLIIVDDEEETREGLRDFIPWATMGIDVVDVASDGIEALELAQKVAPDIIITDVRMARMDGITFVTELRKFSPFCKVIFISGYSDKEYLKSAINLKALSYVEKPLNLQEIQSAVQSAVKTHLEEEANRTAIENTQAVISQAGHLIKQDITLELIDSHMKLETIIDKLQITNSNFLNSKFYYTVIIKFKVSQSNSTTNQTSTYFLEALYTALNNHFNNYLLGGKGTHYYIAHLCDNTIDVSNNFSFHLHHLITSLKEALNESEEIFIGVGKRVNGLDNIIDSYQTAVIAQQQLFFKGYGSIAFYKEFSEEPYIFDKNSTTIFKEYLKEGKKYSAIAYIRNLTNKIRNYSNTLIDYIKDVYFSLALQLSQVAFERGIDVYMDYPNDMDFLWKFISNKDTLIDIETYLLERIENFFLSIEQQSSMGTPVFAIKQYIQANYSKQTLTIQEIADSIHLTPAYLCQIFKKETEVTINQYITNFRIEKAKALLKDKQSKLIEVANKTGYSDANYFTRLFKKNTGSTPSEYREKYLL